ncbi:MAG: cytochrome-c peroxidase, partial [Flavobacteriales bacterium]
MLRRLAYRATTVGALLILGTGCRKDPSTTPPAPTAYLPPLPAWFSDSTTYRWMTPADNPSTVEGVALGRRLFHEVALSDDNSMSCASCHVQADGFSDVRQFSVGTNGAVGRRQAMAVFNLAWDARFFWDGRSHSLEDQAFRPVVDPSEMRNTWPTVVARLQAHPEYPQLFERAFGSSIIDSVNVVRAIAQFERSLISLGSRFDRYRYLGDSTALDEQEIRGMNLFMRGAHCADCHHEPLMADHGLRNNGLDLTFTDLGAAEVTNNPAHAGRFKVPTLRNIEFTPPYMHDGRFATLEEVVDFYAEDVQLESPGLDNHMLPWVGGQVELDEAERADLVAFLKALSD